MKFRLLVVLASAFLLAGCVPHMSQQQCLSTNWYQMGFGDGSAGNAQRNLNRDIQDCAKFKISVNTEAYAKGYRDGVKQFCSPTYQQGLQDGQAGRPLGLIMGRQTLCMQNSMQLNLTKYRQGRNKGLRQFCTFDNGQQLAASGVPMPQVCTGALHNVFARGWQSGQKEFCNNPNTGFALGRAGKPFPGMCSAPMYIAFKSEFQRGSMIFNRIQALQAQIDDISDRINHKVNKYDLRGRYDGDYRLGKNKTPRAKQELREVKQLARERNHLNNQLFNARSAA